MPKTLLLADDSLTIQKAVTLTFSTEDVAVISVGNGQEALIKAREMRPDIIVADVGMAAPNGYDIAMAIKADPQLSKTPVLLLAGTAEPFDQVRASGAQTDGYLQKPFDTQTLINRVKALIGMAPTATVTPGFTAAARPSAPAPIPLVTTVSPATTVSPTASTRPTPSVFTAPVPTVVTTPSVFKSVPPAAPVSVVAFPATSLPQPTPLPSPAVSPFAPAAPIVGKPLSPAQIPVRPASAVVPAPLPRVIPPTGTPLGTATGLSPHPLVGKGSPATVGSTPKVLDPFGFGTALPRAPVPTSPASPQFSSSPAVASLSPSSNEPPKQSAVSPLPMQRAAVDLSLELEELKPTALPPVAFAEPELLTRSQPTAAPVPATPPAVVPTPPPSPSPAPSLRRDGGEALLREALSQASREVIERIAWEVVPQLAEAIIRQELERRREIDGSTGKGFV